GRALLHKRAHALAQVVRVEGRAAQLDQLTLDVLRQSVLCTQQLGYHTLVARLGKWRVRGQLACQIQRRAFKVGGRDDSVHEPPTERRVGIDVAAKQEQLPCASGADRIDEAPQARMRVDQAEFGRRHAE